MNCSDALRRRQRGFTAVEMITVLVLVGVLAVVAMPRMDAGLSLRGAAWRDQVQAGLMHARSQAQGHRRLVCLTLATGELRLAIASANPASACNTAVNGADGDARWPMTATALRCCKAQPARCTSSPTAASPATAPAAARSTSASRWPARRPCN